MNKPTKEEIAAHVATCVEGPACPFRRALASVELRQAPTPDDWADLLITFHVLEAEARAVISDSDTQAVLLAALLARGVYTTTITADEIARHRNAVVTLAHEEDGGATLTLAAADEDAIAPAGKN